MFNLVNGDGPAIGTALSRPIGIDMISFTGSSRAGVLIAKAASTIKRVLARRQRRAWMGPFVSEVQYDKIQGLIQSGIDEGATLVTGGTGRRKG